MSRNTQWVLTQTHRALWLGRGTNKSWLILISWQILVNGDLHPRDVMNDTRWCGHQLSRTTEQRIMRVLTWPRAWHFGDRAVWKLSPSRLDSLGIITQLMTWAPVTLALYCAPHLTSGSRWTTGSATSYLLPVPTMTSDCIYYLNIPAIFNCRHESFFQLCKAKW